MLPPSNLELAIALAFEVTELIARAVVELIAHKCVISLAHQLLIAVVARLSKPIRGIRPLVVKVAEGADVSARVLVGRIAPLVLRVVAHII